MIEHLPIYISSCYHCVVSCIVGQLLLYNDIGQTCSAARTMPVLDINVVLTHYVINYLWIFHYYFQYCQPSYVRVHTYIKCLRWQKPLHGQIVQAIDCIPPICQFDWYDQMVSLLKEDTQSHHLFKTILLRKWFYFLPSWICEILSWNYFVLIV